MRDFTSSYFLEKFGSYKFSVSTLKDFFYSCKTYFQDSTRINFFLNLCGLQEIKNFSGQLKGV